MGLLDLPSPILTQIDRWLDQVPPLAKLVLWAALGAILSMEIYRLLSPQRRIGQIKAALERTRDHVSRFDGEFAEAWPHIRRMLALALRRVFIVLPATLLASLPVLVFIIWLDGNYGGTFPPAGEPVSVAVPGAFEGRWIDQGDGAPPRAEVVDPAGEPVLDVLLTTPIAVVHKRRWWNMLVGNPAGYLPDEAPVERIDIALPRQEFLPVGPSWLRGWEATFFAALVLFALVFKSVRRIE